MLWYRASSSIHHVGLACRETGSSMGSSMYNTSGITFLDLPECMKSSQTASDLITTLRDPLSWSSRHVCNNGTKKMSQTSVISAWVNQEGKRPWQKRKIYKCKPIPLLFGSLITDIPSALEHQISPAFTGHKYAFVVKRTRLSHR